MKAGLFIAIYDSCRIVCVQEMVLILGLRHSNLLQNCKGMNHPHTFPEF